MCYFLRSRVSMHLFSDCVYNSFHINSTSKYYSGIILQGIFFSKSWSKQNFASFSLLYRDKCLCSTNKQLKLILKWSRVNRTAVETWQIRGETLSRVLLNLNDLQCSIFEQAKLSYTCAFNVFNVFQTKWVGTL